MTAETDLWGKIMQNENKLNYLFFKMSFANKTTDFQLNSCDILKLAIEHDKKDIIKKFIYKTGNLNYWIEGNYEKTLLHLAAEHNRWGIAELLIRNGADINPRNYKGITPLHLAVIKNNKELVSILLLYKADINLVDDKGRTPLHWASILCIEDMLILLIKEKALINAKDFKGRTALHFAFERRCEKIIEYLLKNGADDKIKDFNGKKAKDLIR